MVKEHRIELFACRASKDFAAKVIDGLNATRAEGEGPYRL